MENIDIWHDNDFDLAHWVYLNSASLQERQVNFRQIPKTNGPRDILRHLRDGADLALLKAIKYETPDLVISRRGADGESAEILFVAEFMTHTPQHDHPLQRFTRIYGAAFQGFPSVLLIPAQKEKLEKGRRETYRPVMYRANPLIHHLFIRTTEVTGTPTMLMLWPESNGYLKYDPQHPTAPRIEGDVFLFFELVEDIITGRNIESLTLQILEKAKKQSSYSKPKLSDYGMTTLFEVETVNAGALCSTASQLGSMPNLKERTTSLVYSPMGLNSGSSGFRTDPYTGKTCAFDVLFCRDDTGARDKNLILRANGVPATINSEETLPLTPHDINTCPFLMPSTPNNAKKHFDNFCVFTERKQTRVFGTVPDLVVFDGGKTYAPNP